MGYGKVAPAPLIIICAEALALNPSTIASERSFGLRNFIMGRKCRTPIPSVKSFTVTFV
jgi:hypothetical protein